MDKLAKREPGTKLEAARAWASLPEAELKRAAATAARDKDVSTLWAITEAHMSLEKSYSPNTLAAYRRNIARLVETWQHVNLLRPGRDDGRLYRMQLAETLKPASVQQALSAGKALYSALRWAAATEATPFYDVRAGADPVPAHEKRQPYSLDALLRLFEAATEPGMRVEPTTPLMLVLGASVGLRVSEMLGLRRSDIDFATRVLTVRRGKGDKQRTVPLNADALAELRNLPSAPADALIFGGITPHALRDRMRRLCERSGVRYLGVHALRHSAATGMRDNGKALDDISRILGHASITTTAIYAKMNTARLHDAVATLPSFRTRVLSADNDPAPNG